MFDEMDSLSLPDLDSVPETGDLPETALSPEMGVSPKIESTSGDSIQPPVMDDFSESGALPEPPLKSNIKNKFDMLDIDPENPFNDPPPIVNPFKKDENDTPNIHYHQQRSGSKLDDLYQGKRGAAGGAANMLKITSAVIIILALFYLVFSLPALVMADNAGRRLESVLGAESGIHSALMLRVIISILNIIFHFIAGVMGFMNYDNPKGAKKCMIIGFILLAPAIYNFVFSLGGSDRDTILGVTGLIIPGCYTYGAYRVIKDYIE